MQSSKSQGDDDYDQLNQKSIIAKLINKLCKAGIEEPEAKCEVSILEKEFGLENLDKIQSIVNERIQTRRPIQHILGKAFFMDFEVKVNEHVLIPRPETEILVDEAAKRLKQARLALDIGSGSGVIPIGLCKMLPEIEVISIDISQETIKIAQENALTNGVNKQIQFKIYDLFSSEIESLFKENKFDLIISNPPYIKDDLVSSLEPEIALHESKIALSGSRENKTGLVYYERIFELATRYYNKNQLLALEIDPPIVDGIKQILKEHNLTNFEIIKDLDKLERCLFVKI